MKMKLVCEKTGLTDRSVRFYIEEGLIHPDYTENYLGRKTFEFSERDVDELKSIAILRSFGFSIENIRDVLLHPENSHEIVKAVRVRSEEEVAAGRKKVDALAALDGVEGATAAKLAQTLEMPIERAPSAETHTRSLRQIAIAILRTVGVLLVVWLPIVTALTSFGISYFGKTDRIWRPWAITLTLAAMVPSLLAMLLRRHATARGVIVNRVLLGCCAFCIPFGFLCGGEIVSECQHIWGDFATEIAATCSAEGKLRRDCMMCGYHDIAIIEKLPHTEVIDAGKEATCEAVGLTDGVHCSVCKTVLSSQLTVEKKEHHIVTVEAVMPTCTSTGLTEGKKCADCGYKAVKQKLISPTKHTYTAFTVTETCGTKGYTLYRCMCGDFYQKDFVSATERHNFVKNSDRAGYHCTGCHMEVCEHGNVDGSIWGGNDKVKYYITGSASTLVSIPRTLVIYGEGDMPAFRNEEQGMPLWEAGFYFQDITTVRITKGITSIGRLAFSGNEDESSYDHIKAFIIENPNITVNEIDIRGIKCEITYGSE